ncbi:MAG: hypothetical protein R3199_10880 [Gemmatimonadota bacterium]|nr:hypothetical protein [Gemmatimonadota bacterium]
MTLNVASILLWGFVATLILTTVMAGSVALGLSRMSIPFMLGTMITADRNRAPLYGFVGHLMNGWVFAFLYGFTFESLGRATWWLGGAVGVLHALVLLVALMPIFPGLHPRMASEHHGPEPTRALEPPGFMALHYGRRTPIVSIVAHVAYGAILGTFYSLA